MNAVRHANHSHFLSSLYRQRRTLVTIIVLTLLLAALSPQVDLLDRSVDIMLRTAPWPLFLAFVCTALTYGLSAAIYSLLLKHRAALHEVIIVQIATALTAKIAPIGIGTMGLNAIFLRHRRHSLPEALAVVAVNNGLGICGHIAILAAVSLYGPLPSSLETIFEWRTASWILLALALGIAIFTWSDYLWQRTSHTIAQIAAALANYDQRRPQLAVAFVSSMVLSAVYTLALMACCQALGIMLPFQQVFLVYTFSLLVGVVTPTPGGLIGVEAGLVAGFLAYGLTADTALAVALLYRLVTYWLPIVPGLAAFKIVQQRYL